MKKKYYLPVFLSAICSGCGGGLPKSTQSPTVSTPATQSQVRVTAPANNSTVTNSQVHYVAYATSPCPSGVASMGIYTSDNDLAYKVDQATLDTQVTLGPGTYNTTVQEWDNCGGTATTPVAITVASDTATNTPPPTPATPAPAPAPPPGTTLSGLQKGDGWTGYGLLPPSYSICSSCKPGGPNVTWSLEQGIGDPSLGGDASKFDVGGSEAYSDALWNIHLIGDFSSQGLPDQDHSLAPSLHNFTYDVYFYVKDTSVSQALEFDINQFINGKSFIWGHECRIAAGNEWDVWDDQGVKWTPTGIGCNPKSDSWNHLVIQVQRTDDDQLKFESITLNDNKADVNVVEPPGSTGWYGVTINYQMDGNSLQTPYSVWLDKLAFTYW